MSEREQLPEHSSKPPESEPPAKTRPLPGPQDAMFKLQQTAGNRATTALLAASNAEHGLDKPGQPLEPDVRAEMQESFGQNFDDVRVHTDSEAQASADTLGARAYTVGQDIVVGPEQANLQGAQGKQLLAHELTHVVQQRQFPSTQLPVVSQPTDASEGEAAHVAQTVVAGGHAPAIAQSGGGVQRDPKPDPKAQPKLIKDFCKIFPDAGKLVLENAAAMKLVNEAQDAGASFGGFAEDGPGKMPWAYTIAATKTVYVPKARTDAFIAMSDFIFELNNAIRSLQLQAIEKEAAKGSASTITAKQYAYKKVEQEVEGMLRTGEIWAETKKGLPKDPKYDKYDSDFFLASFKAFKEGKKTKEDIIKEILANKSGADPTKTTEQYYMDQFNRK